LKKRFSALKKIKDLESFIKELGAVKLLKNVSDLDIDKLRSYVKDLEGSSELLKKLESISKLAKSIGIVEIPDVSKTKDIEELEEMVKRIESNVENLEKIEPELEVRIENRLFNYGEWDIMRLSVSNKSLKNVYNLDVKISDFEVRGLKPLSLKGMESTVVELGALPKSVGKVPVEIAVTFEDALGNRFEKKFMQFVDVRRIGYGIDVEVEGVARAIGTRIGIAREVVEAKKPEKLKFSEELEQYSVVEGGDFAAGKRKIIKRLERLLAGIESEEF